MRQGELLGLQWRDLDLKAGTLSVERQLCELGGRLFLADETPKVERVALGLILGGACGNGLDRMLHGHVVDFLDFVFGTWHYWYFNIADSCIVVGAILFGIALLTAKKAREAAPAE